MGLAASHWAHSAQVWKVAQGGEGVSSPAISAQSAERYRGPDKARRYEEAKQERRRRREEKKAAVAQAAQRVSCLIHLIPDYSCWS